MTPGFDSEPVPLRLPIMCVWRPGWPRPSGLGSMSLSLRTSRPFIDRNPSFGSEACLSYSDEEEELLAFLRSEQARYYRGDFDAFISHWHHGPEVRRIISGPKTGTRIHVGWDDLRIRFEAGFRRFPQNFDAAKLLRWENMQIQMSGDMAWISYDQIADDLPTGMHADPLTHEIKIVQRIDGEWKLVCLTVVAPEIGREETPRIELDVDGVVVGVNALAQDRLTDHPGLTISGNRPRARIRQFDRGLQDAIERTRELLATNLPRGFLQEQVQVVELGEDAAGYPIFLLGSPGTGAGFDFFR